MGIASTAQATKLPSTTVLLKLVSGTTGVFAIRVHRGVRTGVPSRSARPIASNAGSRANPTGMARAQPSMAPGKDRLQTMIAPSTTKLWRLRSGVSPRTAPSAIPAATWPGVPSELRVLTSCWSSLSSISMGRKVVLAAARCPDYAGLGAGWKAMEGDGRRGRTMEGNPAAICGRPAGVVVSPAGSHSGTASVPPPHEEVTMKRIATLIAMVGLAACQQAAPPARQQAAAGPPKGSPEWKIQNAMSAAPAFIGANATIMDWPAKEGEKPTQLRAGTNGYTCFPDMPMTADAEDPMCLDKVWLDWVDAYLGKKPFKPTSVGVAYMLQGGGAASETDPYKMTPGPGEHFSGDPAHLMLINPDPAALASLPDKRTGGPWVMWKGTPYAHVMVPTK